MLSLTPIGTIQTPFREKFGTPSGSMRVPCACGVIELNPPYNSKDAIQGLEGATHLWIIYLFHQHLETLWRAKVRPPRLGGEKKIGVFATRSPVRPNPIGLSCLLLNKIQIEDERVLLHVKGVDMVDGTPILDIKPYQKEVDCFPESNLAWTEECPWSKKLAVKFIDSSKSALTPEEIELIEQVLSLDPRPSNFRSSAQQGEYKMWLGNWDITWVCQDNQILITKLSSRHF